MTTSVRVYRLSYWPHVLEEAYRAFSDTHGLWGKWKTLLGPWRQIRFMYERMRGRLRYGAARNFAFLSTTRLVINWVVLFFCLGVYGWYYISPDRFKVLGQGLAAVAAKVDAMQAQAALSRFLNMIKGMPNPPCSLAAQFTREVTVPMIITLLKWPTCSPNDRALLIEEIGKLEEVRKAFGTEIRGEFYVSLWSFVEWAENQGYDLNSPPPAF